MVGSTTEVGSVTVVGSTGAGSVTVVGSTTEEVSDTVGSTTGGQYVTHDPLQFDLVDVSRANV